MMIPSPVQTTLKVGVSGAIAYAIAQFFSFSFSFVAPIMAVNICIAGLGVSWIMLLQFTLVFTVTLILGMIEFYAFGNNYIAMFINVLSTGLLYDFFQVRGFAFTIFRIIAIINSMMIVTSNSDKITLGTNIMSNLLIGGFVGIICNSLFWPSYTKDILEKQSEQILNNSYLLCQQMFEGYLKDNFDDSEAQNLRLQILKSIDTSQKLVKVSSLDITGRQLGKKDWQSIFAAEENIAIHLSAILRLIQSSKGIKLSIELEADLEQLFQSLSTCLLDIKTMMTNQRECLTLEPLNYNLKQFHESLKKDKNKKQMKAIPLPELLCFYSIVHRLEKLIRELNRWQIS